MMSALAPRRGFALDSRPGQTERDRQAATNIAEPRGSKLVRAVLRAGGNSAAEPRQAECDFRSFAGQLRESGDVFGDERQRAEAIHRFVHEQILRGNYETSANDLGVTLAGGPFNCATASVLFLALAADFDLDARAVVVPGHVWCRVTDPRGTFDVETTCRGWFEVAASERANMPSEMTQFMAEHQRRASIARVLDRPGLVAIFHYNRGVRYLKEQQFSAAATANLQALELDPRCAPAYDNLLATINNWSLALALQGERELGLGLLAAGLALAADYEPFRGNYRYLSRQRAAAGEASESGEKVLKSVLQRVSSAGDGESNTGF